MEAQQHESKPPLDTAAEIRQILSESVEHEVGQGDSEALGQEAEGQANSGAGLPDDQLPGEDDGQTSLDDDTAPDANDVDTGDDEPADLKFLAEELDIPQADLYDLVVPLGDGETTTLGELKDYRKEFGPIAEAREQVETARNDLEKDKLATIHQWNAVGAAIETPQEQALFEKMQRQAQAYQDRWLTTQNKLIRETMPEWENADTRIADRDAIVALGREYGFSPPEMTATHDARTLRMLRDHARLRGQLAEMQKKPTQQRAKPNAPGKTSGTKLTKRRLAQRRAQAKATPHLHDKASFVRDLLEGNS